MAESRNGPQVRPAPTAWARVRLLKGDSAGGLWDVSSDIPEARIAIGCDPRCGWIVNGSGVAPFHFEVYWDGSVLWAGNSAGAPDVRLDGEALGDWRPISGRARIEFGRAAMLVEASEAAPRNSAVPSSRESNVPLADENTRIAAPMNERREVYASGNSALIKMPPAHELELPADGGATRVVSLADADSGRAVASAPPRVGMGAGVRRIEEPSPISEEATRLGVTPGFGQTSAQVPGGVRIGGGPFVGGQGAAAATGTTAPAMALPPVGLRGPVAGGESPFAAPPPQAPDAGTAAFARVGEKFRGELGKKKLSQPPRTWLLLALVVAVLVVFVLDPFAAKPPVRRAQPGALAGANPAAADAGVAPLGPQAPLAHDFAVGAAGVVAMGPAPVLPDAGVPVPPRPLGRGEVAPLTPERFAADALIAGRYREALPLYQALAVAHPENPTFTQIVVVLQRRLREMCRNGLTPEGLPCAQ